MGDRNKGLFHALLAAVSIAELITSKSKTRSLLLGACTGWHVYATYAHFRDERKQYEKQ